MTHCREFVPKEGDNILIVSPHSDDETIGVGGLISRYAGDKIHFDILLLTNGECADENITTNEAIENREKEFDNAIKLTNVRQAVKLRLPLYSVYKNKKSFRAMLKFDITKYNYVFVPSICEHHNDHRFLYDIYLKIKKKQRAKCVLVQYEITNPLVNISHYCCIEGSPLENKIRMMHEHHSQINDFPAFERQFLSLNAFRGTQVYCQYVEAFYIKPSHMFLKTIYVNLPKRLQKIVEKKFAKYKSK